MIDLFLCVLGAKGAGLLFSCLLPVSLAVHWALFVNGLGRRFLEIFFLSFLGRGVSSKWCSDSLGTISARPDNLV